MNIGAGYNLETGEWAGCKLDSGDWAGSAWRGPEWTPYAQAIADRYSRQVPWYLTTAVDLPAVDPDTPPFPIRTTLTAPQQHDVLIFGANTIGIAAADVFNPDVVYLQITDQASGIPWSVPNKIGATPLPAIAGMQRVFGIDPTLTPALKWPEAFFLRAGTQIKIDWTIITPNGTLDERVFLTFIGVELSRGVTPETILMPNGNEIRVGSRMPWFCTIPMGEFQSRVINDFILAPGTQVSQFTSGANCNIEIHDAFRNFLGLNIGLSVKLLDMGAETFWVPQPSPVEAIFSTELQVNPAMPFPIPYLLRKGHRMHVSMTNENNITPLQAGTLTLRGVRLCEY